MYLTDEVFLYRVVGVAASADGELVELEDCMYLDVVRVPLADVRARRLRVVTPRPLAAESSSVESAAAFGAIATS